MELADIVRRCGRVLTRPWFVALSGVLLIACQSPNGLTPNDVESALAAMRAQVETLALAAQSPAVTPTDLAALLGEFVQTVGGSIEQLAEAAKQTPTTSTADWILYGIATLLGGKELLALKAARAAGGAIIGSAAAPQGEPARAA